jgi:hypothetical protein
MEQKDINPRVSNFLTAHGLPLDTIERDSEGEIKQIEICGQEMPWTVHYSLWVDRMWRDWASELGFQTAAGSRAHEIVIMAGHTHEEFDAWLTAKYGAIVHE